MRAPHLSVFICCLLFVPFAAAEETEAPAPERLQFTEADLPQDEKDPAGLSEIDELARGRGFNYARVARRAARGEAKALKQFFELARAADGAAAESISGMPTVVYHLAGDEKFARFLGAQPLAFRMMVRSQISHDGYPAPASEYLTRYFPRTTGLLFQREMVDWFSPDGRYAIRKVFSDELELGGSKVVRAELIEKKSGRVLCDLTAGDIGTGMEREGEALWSPDSKRVACLSSDLTEEEGDVFSSPRPAVLRRQTAVYQLAGESFVPVELSLGGPPGRESDRELAGAALVHEFTEPIRWRKPDVLILQRHEYFRKKVPIKIGNMTGNSIHDLGRLYQITAAIPSDGKAMVTWKLRDD